MEITTEATGMITMTMATKVAAGMIITDATTGMMMTMITEVTEVVQFMEKKMETK